MDKSMQKYLDKAEVLIEPPVHQRFNRKIIVVKYGGSAMLDEEQEKKSHSGRRTAEALRIQADYCTRRRQGNQ